LLITPDTSNNTQPTVPSTINSGSITKTGLSPNTSYYYDVSLVNAAGVATGIVRESVFTLASGESSAPTPIDATQIQVNWTGTYSSALVTSTNGSISTTTKQNYTSSTTPQANVTGYVYNTGLTNNTSYTYDITLYNGNSIATSLTSKSAYTYPIAPTSLSASSVTDTTLTLGFTSTSTSATTLAYTTTGTNIGTMGTPTNTSGSNYSASVTGLTSNYSYSINVKCTNSTSTLFATSTALTGYTLPSAPSFSASAGTTSTTLTVTKPSGTISSYGFSGGESTSVLGTPTSYTDNCTATVNNLLQNTAYTFYLSAYNSTSVLRSANGSLAFTTDPLAPTSFTGTSTSSTISLTWSYPSSYAWIYDIRSGGTKNATESSDVSTGSWSFSSLTSNTQYTYYLRIKGLSGNYSSDATYSIYTYPDSFTVSVSAITTTGCTLTISAVPSGTITYSLSGGGTLSGPDGSTFTVSGLSASTTYNLTLRATGVGQYTETSTGNFTTLTDVTGYRYYRIGVNHIVSGGGVLVAWANWKFFSDTSGVTAVSAPTDSGKYTLYNSSLTNPTSHVTDQTMSTIVGGFSSTGKYCLYSSGIASDGGVSPESGCVIDFTNSVSIKSYIWYTSNDSPPRDPTSWNFYGSSDNSSWTLLHSGTASANAARNARTPSTGCFSF